MQRHPIPVTKAGQSTGTTLQWLPPHIMKLPPGRLSGSYTIPSTSAGAHHGTGVTTPSTGGHGDPGTGTTTTVITTTGTLTTTLTTVTGTVRDTTVTTTSTTGVSALIRQMWHTGSARVTTERLTRDLISGEMVKLSMPAPVTHATVQHGRHLLTGARGEVLLQ
jgi:hypothetical protein